MAATRQSVGNNLLTVTAVILLAGATAHAPRLAAQSMIGPPPATAKSPGNAKPTISGNPSRMLVAGSFYDFRPAASDPDSARLQFSVNKMPAWANFDSTTGRLYGTPSAIDVGKIKGIRISVSDGEKVARLTKFGIKVIAGQPPVISGTPSATATEGQAYQFQPSASDADKQDLQFAITNRPAWASFDKYTGRLHGTPPAGSAGTYAGIRISVTDGATTVSLPAFTITVAPATVDKPGNTPAKISGTPPARVAVGQTYDFTPSASDPDGDTLTFSSVNVPAWLSFDRATGRLNGRPAAGQEGTYSDIVVSVNDGTAFTFLAPFSITVTATQPVENRAPTISGTPAAGVEEGKAYAFQPTAADADGDALTFSAANLPGWLALNPGTGRVSGTAPAGSVGTYGGIVISVSDGRASAALPPFAVTVTAPDPVNQPPTISGSPPTIAVPGQMYMFQPTASDPEQQPLRFSISNKPTWLGFDFATGRLSGVATEANLGISANIVIIVSDGTTSVRLPAFSISVQTDPGDGNRTPSISGTPAASVTVGRAYSFQPTASDPDGQTLRFGIANQPSWADFDIVTGRLTGTPAQADVGSYGNIVISVSDGLAAATLPAFSVTVLAASVDNRAPTISGIPASSVTVGQAYSFQPTASDPDGDVLRFGIANKPSWAMFDIVTGRLSGTPVASDVGDYGNIVISVSDGKLSATLPAFGIMVKSVDLPGAAAEFQFADVPEFSFVYSYAETENLGIWQLDATNRWTPGDLDNRSGWKPKVQTELQVLEGSLDGVSYDPATAVLSYDGKGTAGWARVRLVAPKNGASSNEFFVRVLMPKVIWGSDATTRADIAEKFPGVPKFDYGKTSYDDAWRSVPKNGTRDDPDVMLMLGGSYDSAVEAKLTGQVDTTTGELDRRVNWHSDRLAGTREYFYLLGEPGKRPKVSGLSIEVGGILNVAGIQVSAARNIELETMVVKGNSGWQLGSPLRRYWSKLYVHHTCGLAALRPQWPTLNAIADDVFGSASAEGDTLGTFARQGVPIAPNDWKSFFWGNRFYRTGGNDQKHTIYLHGRPDVWLVYNNNSFNGGNGSSAVKATVGHYRVLNSRISAFADEANPGDPTDRLSQQLLDVPSSSDSVIYNNHLIGGWRRTDAGNAGTRTGLIWFNPRLSLWATDRPRYPDITYQEAPFQPFNFEFSYSGIAGPNPAVVALIQVGEGPWVPLATQPSYVAEGKVWMVTVRPEDVPVNGTYRFKISDGTKASDDPITFNVYRNARYLAVTSFADAQLKAPWYSDGPKAYVIDDGDAYWRAMMSWGGGADGRRLADNPYTLKKFIAYNRFTWLIHPDLLTLRSEAIRDNGTYPTGGNFFSPKYGAVPASWHDAGVTFLANNVYEGWQPEDVGTENFLRTDNAVITNNPKNELYGPGQSDPLKKNWPNYFEVMPTEKQPIFVQVGGERTPVDPAAAPIELPAWFRIY